MVSGGYNDWFLPSAAELSKLYGNRIAIGGFTTGIYWSSTEVDSHPSHIAWMFSVSWIEMLEYSNDFYSRVRAIRYF